MIVLDCTFRDGGYHNNWMFNINIANTYLSTMEKSKINAIEIGFRSPVNYEDPRFFNVTDEFIEDKLNIPKIEYFGVMVNNNKMNSKIIKQLFRYSDKSPINLVRVAVHFKDIDTAEIICKDLKNLGYTISCNLMQAADKSFDEIKQISKKIEDWKCVDILYLADSFGAMNHDDINYSYKAIRSEWSGLTGFHGHNNKGQALNNSLEAVDIGVDWIDCTICGMGRGPGNTETEYLLAELNIRGYGEFELNDIYRLSLTDFTKLKEKFGWGPSLLYYLAAEYSIHPTYIQRLLIDLICKNLVLDCIYYLKNKKCNTFNEELLKETINECRDNNTCKVQ